MTGAILHPTNSLTAEVVKTLENAYRDVQIAFANELAIICESVGGDVWTVRELVNHLVGGNLLFAGILRGASMPERRPASPVDVLGAEPRLGG